MLNLYLKFTLLKKIRLITVPTNKDAEDVIQSIKAIKLWQYYKINL